MVANFSKSSSLASLPAPKHGLGSTLLIYKALKEPVYLNRLCDRVYQIMLADLQQQQRNGNYIGL